MKSINIPEETYTNLNYMAGKIGISPTLLLTYCVEACFAHPDHIGVYLSEQLRKGSK